MGLSSPRSESLSASAMAYAGTGSRFFTRILAAYLTRWLQSNGTCRRSQTNASVATGDWTRGVVCCGLRSMDRERERGVSSDPTGDSAPRRLASRRINVAISKAYFCYTLRPLRFCFYFYYKTITIDNLLIFMSATPANIMRARANRLYDVALQTISSFLRTSLTYLYNIFNLL